MKKLFLSLIIISVFITYNVKAQFTVGPKVGLNWAMITDTTSTGFKGVLAKGKHFGAVVNYAVNSFCSIQTEINYSAKGEEQRMDEGGYFQKLSTNYIEIPVLAKLTFGKSNLKGFVNAGPYFAYWTSGKYTWKDPEGIHSQNYKFENLDFGTTTLKDNRMDLGIAAGLGAMYKIGPGNITLESRFGYGLSKINSYSGDKLPGWINKSNRVLSVSLGYMISLDSKSTTN